MNYMHERHVVSASALPGRPALAAREGLIAALQRYAEEKGAGFSLYPMAEGPVLAEMVFPTAELASEFAARLRRTGDYDNIQTRSETVDLCELARQREQRN